VPYFDFADTLFNVPREQALRVCQELVDRKVRIKFEVELNPIGQDEESVKLLKAAGCIGVDLTADSGSDTMLINLKKGFTKDMVRNVARLYKKYSIPYTVGFILGGAGENLKTIGETVKFAEELPSPSAAYFAVGIRVFKGTMLEKMFYKGEGDAGCRDDLLKLNFFIDKGFDKICADRLLAAYEKNLRFYISDFFYQGDIYKTMRIADMLNIRPAWKCGWIPRAFEKIKNIGRTSIYWNEKNLSFQLIDTK